MKPSAALRLIAALLLCLLVVLPGCRTVQAEDLCAGLTPNPVAARAADDPFVASQMRFAVSLFREVTASGGENVLLSPLLVQLALAMTANGAAGQTLEEMQALLGGSIPLAELNEYLHTYVNGLPSGEQFRLHLANSVWFRDDESRISPEPDFLQTVADYYAAQVYAAPFDEQTVEDINNWVSRNTDGMIDRMIADIPPEAVMYLISALAFDAEWEAGYDASDIREGVFTAASGQRQTVQMMHSTESRYFETDNAIGFFKDYQGGSYSFVGILPDADLPLADYVAGLDAAALLSAMQSAREGLVSVVMPQFSYADERTLNDCLCALAMPSAFVRGQADFSGIQQGKGEVFYISQVLHKAYISVDEKGTQAGAAAAVIVADGVGSSEPISIERTVLLDRPFLYLIVDNATNLPLLIGTVTSVA